MRSPTTCRLHPGSPHCVHLQAVPCRPLCCHTSQLQAELCQPLLLSYPSTSHWAGCLQQVACVVLTTCRPYHANPFMPPLPLKLMPSLPLAGLSQVAGVMPATCRLRRVGLSATPLATCRPRQPLLLPWPNSSHQAEH